MSNDTHETQFTVLSGIADFIEATTGISLLRLRSKQRLRTVCDARYKFCLLARKMNLSYGIIGDFLHKDHTAIMYLVKRYKG